MITVSSDNNCNAWPSVHRNVLLTKGNTLLTRRPQIYTVSRRGQALVAVMNNLADWRIVHQRLGYRVPVDRAPSRWPPEWLAFYQTKTFGPEAIAVRYYGKVARIARVRRKELFPNEPTGAKSDREYFQVFLEKLEKLPAPIVSYRLRLIVFIATSYAKLMTATEINDLYDDSPLEDALWTELKKLNLRAKRQYFLTHRGQWYSLDFAMFCENGKLDIETDGDAWHNLPERVLEDNRRNNALAAQGYQVLRFSTSQVREELATYCVPKIVETVNRLGGILDPTGAPRTYTATDDGIVQQMNLFETGDSDEA